MNLQKQRIPYFEFLRGLAIMMVVAIHTFDLEQSNCFSIAIRQITNAGVPIFLAISGFFLIKKDMSTRGKYFSFLRRQIPKVYFPALIWSIPFFVVCFYSGFSLTKNLFYFFTCGHSIYYFVFLIIQYYLLLPLFGGINLKWVLLCVLISMTEVTLFKYYNTIDLPLVIYAGNFPMWIMFFAVGAYLGKMVKRDYKITPWIIVFIISMVLCFFEMGYFSNLGIVSMGIKPTSFLVSISLIMICFSSKVQKVYKSNIFSHLIEIVGGGIFWYLPYSLLLH